MIQATVEPYLETLFQINRISQFIKMNWPTAETQPINEFSFDGFASLAFPSLFQHG